ncbi:MAG: hypothetical protein OHK0057_31760 [Thermoflexibacter sp.]
MSILLTFICSPMRFLLQIFQKNTKIFVIYSNIPTFTPNNSFVLVKAFKIVHILFVFPYKGKFIKNEAREQAL